MIVTNKMFIFKNWMILACVFIVSCAEDTVLTSDNLFENQVQSILTVSCVTCHSSSNPQSGIRLENYDHVLSSSGNVLGKLVVPGDVNGSPLVKVIEGKAIGVSKMPLGGSLTSEQIKTIKERIKNGAKNE